MKKQYMRRDEADGLTPPTDSGRNLNPMKNQKRLNSFKLWLQAGVSLAVLTAGIYIASIALGTAAETKTTDVNKATEVKLADAKTVSSKTEKKPAQKPAKKVHKKLTGAELYAMNCNRCHEERYPTERTDAQWKTILMHMQVRAQLPGKDARAILKYLQENN